MSTLQRSTNHPQQPRTRLRAVLVALGALVAIGVAVLMISITGARHTTIAPSTGSAAHSHAAPSPVATPTPARYFRDPATHALLRVH